MAWLAAMYVRAEELPDEPPGEERRTAGGKADEAYVRAWMRAQASRGQNGS